MDRLTDRDLDTMVRNINRATGSPLEPYTKTETGFRANPDCYHIDKAYGGNRLVRVGGDGRGEVNVLRSGYVSKRELYQLMDAYLCGIVTGKQLPGE